MNISRESCAEKSGFLPLSNINPTFYISLLYLQCMEVGQNGRHGYNVPANAEMASPLEYEHA